jgi:hypothetical protein
MTKMYFVLNSMCFCYAMRYICDSKNKNKINIHETPINDITDSTGSKLMHT